MVTIRLQGLGLEGVRVLVAFVLLNTSFASPILEARASSPAPLAITASQSWDGNDGPWSTFPIAIGTPPQLLKLLVATSSGQTWAVATEGCVSGDPQSCAEDRGGLWDRKSSTSYLVNTANSTTDIYLLDLEDQLGNQTQQYTGKGRYGFDTVQLGWQSSAPQLKNQTVVGIADKSYFMGLFGLDPRPSNFTGDDKLVQSVIATLKDQSIIPSLSWAYTAGNQYRSSSKTVGSLTLGGYDTSKFTPNGVTFAIAEDERDLMTSIEKITTDSGNTNLLPERITAYLDSAVPFIYLPVEACVLFEKAFSLTWNETKELYIVSDVEHTLLLSKNPSVTFVIGSATQNTEITLPYAAFDLTATYPFTESVNTNIRYFPLRRAMNSTQYTLGRTFFQEAYVIADYERRNFSISQATFDSRAVQNLVAIYPIGGPKSSIPIAAIAGGAAGGALLLIAALVYFFWWRPRQRKRKPQELDSHSLYHPLHPNSHQKDPAYIKVELDAGEDHQARDGRGGKPVELGDHPAEIYEMDGGDVIHEIGNTREEKRGSWLWGKDKKAERDRRASRQNTTDTFGFPKTPSSPFPTTGGDSSIQNTPAINYATPVPSPRRPGDPNNGPYRDRTPSPDGIGTMDSMGFPRSTVGSVAISSASSSLRLPPGTPGRRGSPIVSPQSAVPRDRFQRFI